MEALLSLDNPASSSLRVLHDKIESHTRQLKALGVPEEAYNCLLPSLVMKRLPKDIALSISRRIPEDNWNLASIMKELDDELKVRERTYDKSGHSNDHKRFESNYRRSREQPTAAALLTNVSHCCYCRETHPAEECAKMPKVEERKQFFQVDVSNKVILADSVNQIIDVNDATADIILASASRRLVRK